MKTKYLKKNEKINIFFSCDDNYIPFLAVSLESLIKNASRNYLYNIYILHTRSISQASQDDIKERYNKEVFNIEFVDISSHIKMFSEKLHTRDYYSKNTYFRLFIPNLYPKMDKALYLDSDITILKDISKLYNTKLGNNLVGGVPDGAVQVFPEFKDYVENKIGVESFDKYFNAGVLLMNLKRMREIDFENVFLNMLTKITFTVAQDQDYLNAICKRFVKILDRVWNVMPIPNQGIKEKDILLIHITI